jgi:hypothetical protein
LPTGADELRAAARELLAALANDSQAGANSTADWCDGD